MCLPGHLLYHLLPLQRICTKLQSRGHNFQLPDYCFALLKCPCHSYVIWICLIVLNCIVYLCCVIVLMCVCGICIKGYLLTMCLRTQMGSCWNCKSVVPVNMPKCLACDVLLTTDRTALQPKQQVDTGCLLCAMCGTPNSRNNRAGSCDTCSASLNTAKVAVLMHF